jgi:hypothetical protein
MCYDLPTTDYPAEPVIHYGKAGMSFGDWYVKYRDGEMIAVCRNIAIGTFRSGARELAEVAAMIADQTLVEVV